MSKPYFNGNPIGYQISYYPTGLKNRLRFLKVTYTKNHTILPKLTAFTEYSVNVSAVSSGGMGPEVSTTARTDADG